MPSELQTEFKYKSKDEALQALKNALNNMYGNVTNVYENDEDLTSGCEDCDLAVEHTDQNGRKKYLGLEYVSMDEEDDETVITIEIEDEDGDRLDNKVRLCEELSGKISTSKNTTDAKTSNIPTQEKPTALKVETATSNVIISQDNEDRFTSPFGNKHSKYHF